MDKCREEFSIGDLVVLTDEAFNKVVVRIDGIVDESFFLIGGDYLIDGEFRRATEEEVARTKLNKKGDING